MLYDKLSEINPILLSFGYLFVTRSENKTLMLHQKRPRNIKKNKYCIADKRLNYSKFFTYGQVFRLDEFENSEKILYHTVPDIVAMCRVLLNPEGNKTNVFYATRAKNGELMLHQKKPVRIRETNDFNHFIDEEILYHENGRKRWRPTGRKVRWCRKDANKWSVSHVVEREDGSTYTKEHGYFRIHEFPGSYNIKFDDAEPTEVTVELFYVPCFEEFSEYVGKLDNKVRYVKKSEQPLKFTTSFPLQQGNMRFTKEAVEKALKETPTELNLKIKSYDDKTKMFEFEGDISQEEREKFMQDVAIRQFIEDWKNLVYETDKIAVSSKCVPQSSTVDNADMPMSYTIKMDWWNEQQENKEK